MADLTLTVQLMTDASKLRSDVENALSGIKPVTFSPGTSGGGRPAIPPEPKSAALTLKGILGIVKGITKLGIIAMVMAKIIGGIFSAIQPIFNVISVIGKILGTLIMSFLRLFMPIFMAIAFALMPVVKTLNLILRPFYMRIMTALREAVKSGATGFELVGAVMTATLSSLAELMVIIFSEVFKLLGSLFIESLITPFQVLIMGIGALVTLLLGAIGIDVSSQVGSIVGAIVGYMEVGKQALIGAWTGIIDKVKGGLLSVFSGIEMSIGQTQEKAETTLTPVQQFLDTVGTSLFGESFQKKFEDLATKANNLRDAIHDAIVNFDISAIKTKLDEVGLAAQHKFAFIHTIITETLNNIISQLAWLKEYATNTLGTVFQSLADKLKPAWEKIKEGVSGAIGHIKEHPEMAGAVTTPVSPGLGMITPILTEIAEHSEKTTPSLTQLGKEVNTLGQVSGPSSLSVKNLSNTTVTSFQVMELTTNKTTKVMVSSMMSAYDIISRVADRTIKAMREAISAANAAKRAASSVHGSYQVGGVVPRTGVYLLHGGERVIPPGRDTTPSQNINISPNIHIDYSGPSTDPRRLAEQISDIIYEELRRRVTYG